MKKIAVFASGSGSNFQSIVDEIDSGTLEADVRLLVCDRPGARATERAEAAGIPVFSFRAKEYESKEAFEREIIRELEAAGVEFIVLAGYMRLIGPTLLEAFGGRIVNIHPSILPAFPGKDAIGQAFDGGVKVTGVTIHYVDAGMDTGEIIAQEAVTVEEDETRESLQRKIQAVEHRLYPATLRDLFRKKVMGRSL
ncbi:phosphoribosylglycinamide formyltransferase [Rossellomorea marisflavi]|uniref:Phosphoribosylglycinamide formyltransferase n=1 Tax=Rossellomorea marisflavi TaxID=189381 RepID=A0A165LTV5_9BACI|nr:phosphoribosylglycinamide formyltransferase [Rossellomorea marisflavi]KZE52964.1 phosphoribosylglycinamide formyltransferase [Rossellomorea marisflavi]QHA34709.1 phosphoribosylglycinamide formyltransferase [Rossellomorea marisflavi]TYO69191.1 phosphoribosylglycinamide formyltransferase [Rossellomorea marisflavi]